LELVAGGRTEEEVRVLIGADWLIYQDLDDLVASVRYDNANIDEFDTSCFSGNYVAGDVTPEYLRRLECQRSDSAKSNREARTRRLEGEILDGVGHGDGDNEEDDGDLAAGSHAGVA